MLYEWYLWYIVDLLGGPAHGIYYVDHRDHGAQALQCMGQATAGANFPMDNTYMALWLADIFMWAFVLGVKCGAVLFEDLVVNAISWIKGDLLEYYKQVNSTLPIKRSTH